MGAIQERLASAQGDVADAREQLSICIEELKARRLAEFVLRGGCEKCNGRGWVVTWDTLDMMDGSAATYGSCPKAGDRPEAHGDGAPFNHAIVLHHDRWNNSRPTLEQSKDEQKTRAQFQSALDRARSELLNAEHAAKPAIGKEVRAVKGRKVPLGTEGRVFWTGDDGYGPGLRLGIETAKGERVFIAAENVEVI